MNWKSKWDKAIYIMLSVSAMAALFVFLLDVGLSILSACYWHLDHMDINPDASLTYRIIRVFTLEKGIRLAPFILHIIGGSFYKKGKTVIAGWIGLANCMIALVGNIYILCNLEHSEVVYLFAFFPNISLLYMSIVMVLLIISMRKKKQS